MIALLQSAGAFWNAFNVSTLELMFKGLLIGMLASAPMGPVGILCIRRTMQKGRIYGIVTGAGAALSDIIYALITGLGMSFMMDFVSNETNLFVMKLVGSIMLFIFGIYMFRADATKGFVPNNSGKKGTLLHNFFTAFLLTVSNPLIIFLFTALYAMLAFVVPEHLFEQCVGYASIVGGAMLWWWLLTKGITRMNRLFSLQGVTMFNRSIGVVVIVISFLYAIMTVFKLQFSLL